MNPALGLRPHRRLVAGLALSVALAAAALAAVALPADAAPPKRTPSAVLVALILPFAGHSERGIVHLVQGNRIGTDGVGTIAIAGTFDDDQVLYGLRLSRRSCRGLRRNPRRPMFLTDLVIDPFQSTTFDDEAIAATRALSVRSLRAARSVVLVARGDGGKFEPRACGNAYSFKLEDVLVSS